MTLCIPSAWRPLGGDLNRGGNKMQGAVAVHGGGGCARWVSAARWIKNSGTSPEQGG